MKTTVRFRYPHSFWVLALVFPTSVQAGQTAPYMEQPAGQRSLLVASSVCCSVVYTPVKAVYAAGGTVAGGMVFLMSAGQSATAAGRILERTTRGDWYIHPDHLTGHRRLRFRGSTGFQRDR